MREWVRERPFEDRVWDTASADNREVGRRVLSVSTPPSGPERFGAWKPSFRFEHGDEVLLDLALEIRIEATEVEGWLERGVKSESYGKVFVHATRCQLDPDFHAAAVLTVEDRAAGEGRGPALQLDVFVLAGPGQVELIEHVGHGPSYRLKGATLGTDALMGMVLKGMLFGIMHPMGGPPSEGIGYHAQSKLYATWSREEGGSEGAGFGIMGATATTRQYSIRIDAESVAEAPYSRDAPSTMTREVSLSYTWNGEVW